MIGYTTQASWVLSTAFTVSAPYELSRSTTKAGTSRYDSTWGFVTQAVPATRPRSPWPCWFGRDGDG